METRSRPIHWFCLCLVIWSHRVAPPPPSNAPIAAPFLPPITAPRPAPAPADDPMMRALFLTERVGRRV